MRKLSIPLSLLAVATLAACGSTRDIRTSYTEPMVQVTPVGTTGTAPSFTAPRPGLGRIVYLVDPTGPVDGVSVQHMTLMMADGSTQVVTRRGEQIAAGTSVQVSR